MITHAEEINNPTIKLVIIKLISMVTFPKVNYWIYNSKYWSIF